MSLLDNRECRSIGGGASPWLAVIGVPPSSQPQPIEPLPASAPLS